MRRFVPPVPRRGSFARIFSGVLVAVGLALTTISAQIPGRNINMVAGNTWPNGDPYLQRQNEPSIAASTRNPLHLIAGSNDYRTVDLPGLSEDETGDAWLGLFKSYDGGQRWTSTLLPGYPQDNSAAGLASPIHGYGAGADPVVRAGTNGLIYYAGLTFDRPDPAAPAVPGKSAIFVSRFIDNNNKEAGDTFEYLGTRTLQTDPGGATGNFLDKPWMVVDIPRDNTRCTIVTPGEHNTAITQSVPAGPVYVAYTLRSTDSKGSRYDVMFTRSTDCGNTWTMPVQLNSNSERANQGAALAVDPRNGNVYIAWRQFDVSTNNTGTDALMTAKFTLAGKKLDPPGFARKFAKPKKGKGKGLNLEQFYKKGGVNKALEAAELSPLDQSTSAALIRFRTNAYPAMVLDETGRIYLAWAERGFDPLSPDPVLGAARILMATSLDGKSWTTAMPVSSENQKGHQLMPSLTYAGGKLMLIYYDIRQTRANSFTRYIDDKSSFTKVDPEATGLRHTIDLRASMASPGAIPAFAPSVAVSEYIEGPRVPGGPNTPWQVNPPNLPMFQKGTAPFIGDYVDVTAAPNFVIDAAGKWAYNAAATSTPPIFHAAWTDNRDVRVPLHDMDGDGNPWNDYVPPGAPGGFPSIFDPTKVVPQCIPGNAGSRNQNIYTARITGGLLVGSPGNTKRLGYRIEQDGTPTTQLMERSFVVFAQNTADVLKRFRFTIANQPAGGRASFDQFSAAPLTAIDADIPYRSTASRTVYATSTDPHAVITVNVAELVLVNNQWVVNTDGLTGNIILNPDIDNPDIDNPDIDNPDIDNPDIDNAEVYNPDIDNPDIDNPDIDNPDIDNPDIDNPDIDNVTVANPDIDNPDIDNPDIDNPDIDNPDIDNPDIDNPDIDNASLMTDVSWSITNTGNTTASYNVNLFFAQQTFDPQIKTQLILYRTYKTPVVVNCELKSETRNVLVANVPDPQLVYGSTGTVSNPNDSAATNATIYLAPGEAAKITLRVFDPSPDPTKVVTVTNADGSTAKISSEFVPNEDVTPVVQQQSVNTEDVDNDVTEPPVVVQFPAPQTVADSASTSQNTPVTLNVLANDSTAFGSTKVISFHPAGMASHSGATAGDIVYQPASGFLYTARGAVDPVTHALVARFPVPPGGVNIVSQVADPIHGINYGRSGAPNSVIVALDASPGSVTFHTYLPMPSLSDSVLAIALDAPHNRLYAAHGPQTATSSTPTTVTAFDITRGATFGTVVGSVSLPAGIRAQSMAINTRTRQLYLATTGTPSVVGGVFLIDATSPGLNALRLPNIAGAFGIVVNEAANLIFASTAQGPSANFGLYAIDGATNAATLIPTGVPFRFGSNDERLAVHEASGKVYMRLQNTVIVIDGQRGSPTRNTVLATINVGRENGGADIAVDQEKGVVVTVGSVDFQADVIDVSSNALVTSIPLTTWAQDVAIDPVHHRAFLGVFTFVQPVDLDPAVAVGIPVPVFVENGSILLNPLKNNGYTGLFTTQAKLAVISGSGLDGMVNGDTGAGRYLYSDWYTPINRGFVVSQGNDSGTSGDPGSVAVVEGASDTVLGYADVPANPFGIGIDQVTGKVYVATLSTPNMHGQLAIVDANSPQQPATLATLTSAVGATAPAFPLINPGALLSFGRYVVVNPANHKVYVIQLSGGSPTSLAVYDPNSNVLKPLDGLAGTSLYDAQAAAGENWGRVAVIRADATLNRIFLGFLDNNNVGRIVALDSATDTIVGTPWVGGSHSNRHTASFLLLNEATSRLYVTDYTNNTVTMLDAATLLPDPLHPAVAIPGGPSATAFNTVSNRLYVSSIDNKTLSSIDGATLQVISTVKMPLTAYFMWVDPVESRVYTSGGDAADESGAMVITDVLGQLGTNVSVTSVGSAMHGTAQLNADNSVTYTPAAGYSGPDSFSYNIAAPTGTAIGTVNINVVGSTASAIAFPDSYATTDGVLLTVPAPGPLANDAAFNTPAMNVGVSTPNGTLTPQPDGSFTYLPNPGFTGVDTFTYYVNDDVLGNSNVVTVSIAVNQPDNPVVTSANDSGAGSLRAALTYANATPGTQTITFNIPGVTAAAPATIALASALPTLAGAVVIDASTQPGYDGKPVIALDGGNNIPYGLATAFDVSGVTIKGLMIRRFTSVGIYLLQAESGTGNIIDGNFIGTDRAATSGLGNANGMLVRTDHSIIRNNVISGNVGTGIIVELDADDVRIQNNRIGVDHSGLLSTPNGGNGITIYGSINDPVIENNNISGNGAWGIEIQGGGGPDHVTNTVIRGNVIGLRSDGTLIGFSGDLTGETSFGPIVNFGPQSRGNRLGGIKAQSSPDLKIGQAGQGNTISGNSGPGIFLENPFGNAPVIIANIIGLDQSAALNRGNTTDGILSAWPGVQIGGYGSGEGNIVSGNISNGIRLGGDGSLPQNIVNNRIGTNAAGNAVIDPLGVPLGNGKLTNPDFGCCHAGVFLNAGNTTLADNLIGGNMIGVRSTITTGAANVIDHNNIGTDAGGTLQLRNAVGVFLAGDNRGTTVKRNRIAFSYQEGVILAEGTQNAVIGGSAVQSNTIHNNDRGIVVGYDATTNDTNNDLTANRVYGNTGPGIDIGNDGVTPNDGGDGDSGPNNLQNFPVMVSAIKTGASSLEVTVDVSSFASSNLYEIEFYATPTCDSTGYGEGQVWLGRFANVAGPFPGTQAFTLNQPVAVGWQVTALARAAGGHTSEFSNCVTAQTQPPVVASVVPSTFAPGQMITIDGSNFAAVGAGDVIIRQGGNDFPATYVWQNTATRIIARTGAGPNNGPAEVIIRSNGSAPQSAAFAVTVSNTPGAPFFEHLFHGVCGSYGYGGTPQNPASITNTSPGASIVLVAEGIDTTGVTVIFTPTGPGATFTAPATSACAGPLGQVAITATVPAGVVAGATYNVTMTQQVGFNTSPQSNARSVTIGGTFSVLGTSGGQANTNCACGFTGTSPVQTFSLAPNQQVTISGSGFANYGPSGSATPAGIGTPAPTDNLAPGLIAASLVGRIGTGPWQQIGSGATLTAGPFGGTLELAMNDSNYSDNSGAWTVTVVPHY